MATEPINWYHGKISRDIATNKLRQNNKTGQEGYFLIRDCSSAPNDFSLSIWIRDKKSSNTMHFQIQCLGDNKFVIDNGPIFQGLDSLVRHYKTNSDGLPCKLGNHCPGHNPPLKTLKYGLDTKLHRACFDGNVPLVKQILQNNQNYQDINARNKSGQTPLHIACSKGNESLVVLLLQAGADTSSVDSYAKTPIQIACFDGNASLLRTLILKGHADFHERSLDNGMVPLHEVAMRGNLDCVKVLLSFNASLHPRTPEGDTPKDLAARFSHLDVENFFETYPVPSPKTSPSQWLHQNLDRTAAVQMLTKANKVDGLFLIRTSEKFRGYCDYVLSLCLKGKVYNYQIKSRADRWFYIDDGPLFETLPHLVDHYMKHSDGLPTILKEAIPSSISRIPPRPSVRPNVRPVRPGLSLPPVPPEYPSSPHSSTTSSTVSSTRTTNSDSRTTNSDDELDSFNQLTPEPNQTSPRPLNLPRPPTAGGATNQTMITMESLKKEGEIGQGEFGAVFKGVWINSDGKQIPVAMKTLHHEKFTQGEKEFLREARVMSQLDHPCIVRLLGVCLGPPMILVQELVSMGALLDFLMDHQDEILEVDIKLWAAQIAWGMMYLEQKRFVHRDLATRNILLANKNQCKISDFGLSRAVGSGSDYYQAQQGGRWPVKWYAPESILYGTFSQKSDVWSYGVTLWEMFSFGELPYGEISGGEVIALLEANKRLDKPDHCPDHTYQIMLRCWHIKPASRPTFKELHEIFSTDPEYEDARSFRERLKN